MKRTKDFVCIVFYCKVVIFLLGCAQPSRETVRMEETPLFVADSLPKFDLDYIMGKFNPSEHPDFILIEGVHASGPGMYMRKDAYKAYIYMYEAAQKEGIHLVIVSAARNFDRQTQIWNAKWTGKTLVEGGVNLAREVKDPLERAKRILRFSSMPGSSRHHWGTDVDLNALEDAWFLQGEGKKVYNWLTSNAGRFGYCQTYTTKGVDRPNGYEEEKWHWTYTPVSNNILKSARSLLTNQNISGFEGSETASHIGILENYVFGINPACEQVSDVFFD